MGRLRYETVTPVDSTDLYTLTAIRDVVRIEIVDSLSLRAEDLKNWRSWYDETTDPPARKLIIPTSIIDTSTTWRVVGYSPYAIPTYTNDASTSDIPTDKEHIVIAGARVSAYRARVNRFMDFEQHALENPTTRTQLEEFQRAMLAASAEFERLMLENARDQASSKRSGLG